MIALNLTIKKKWFDLIRIGAKKEEYRTCRNKAALRLFNAVSHYGHLPDNAIIFRNGYNMGSAAVAVETAGLSLRSGDEVQHPEWGARNGWRTTWGACTGLSRRPKRT